MKYLFLDIDGVLNRDTTKERVSGFIGVDFYLLNKFLKWKKDRPAVSIVLSSSWRIPTAFADLREHLKSVGIEWVSETPRIPGAIRGHEIATWLAQNDYTHFAILDDTSEMEPVHKNLVQTSYVHGLRDKDLKRLDKLLGYA